MDINTRKLAIAALMALAAGAYTGNAIAQDVPTSSDRAAPTVPVVVDSAGKLVGVYGFSPTNINGFRESVLIKTSRGTYFAVAINGNQFLDTGGLSLDFTSTNCSGQAYVSGLLFEDGTAPPLVPMAVVIGTTAYVPGRAVATVAIQSQLTGQGCFANSYSASEIAVSSTFDLGAFTPPFAVR